MEPTGGRRKMSTGEEGSKEKGVSVLKSGEAPFQEAGYRRERAYLNTNGFTENGIREKRSAPGGDDREESKRYLKGARRA